MIWKPVIHLSYFFGVKDVVLEFLKNWRLFKKKFQFSLIFYCCRTLPNPVFLFLFKSQTVGYMTGNGVNIWRQVSCRRTSEENGTWRHWWQYLYHAVLAARSCLPTWYHQLSLPSLYIANALTALSLSALTLSVDPSATIYHLPITHLIYFILWLISNPILMR